MKQIKIAQWRRLLKLMSDGNWYTPMDIHVSLKLLEHTEIANIIHDLRKRGFEVESKVVRDTWRYRLKMSPLKVAA